jgi:membrane protein
MRPAELVAELKTLGREVLRLRLLGLAGEVAFWAVFSLFPGLLIAAGLLGTLDALLGSHLAASVEAQVLGALRDVLTSKASPLLESVGALFHVPSNQVLTTGALVSLWSISSGMATAMEALDLVYGVADTRSWLRQRLVAIGLGVGTVLVFSAVLALLVVGPAFGGGDTRSAKVGLGEAYAMAWDWLRGPAALLALTVWTATVFHLGPSFRGRWREDMPGAILTALLSVLGSLTFRVYLGFSAEGNPVVGLLGGGLVLMLWFYLLAFVLLLGAQVNSLARARKAKAARLA